MGLLEKSLPEYAVFTQIDKAINWARSFSLSYLTMDLACCGIEMMHVNGARYDIERFGAVPVVSPDQADLMICAGTISYKTASYIREFYEKMPLPRFVISLGSCSNLGGPFSWEYSYSSVSGLDKIVPVDVYVPGCPPRPEAILHGLILLQKKILTQKVLIKEQMSLNG